jgi:RNA polymerase sigma-70 factor (ECF subfamily)
VAVESGAREQTAVRCPPGHRASPATAVRAVNRDVHLDTAVEAALRGDEAAFARVYRTVQPGLLRYLAVLVGADAEDVASETWAQVCRDLGTFHGDGDGFRGWVATIGRHRALDHLRARGRRPVASVPVEHLVALPAPEDTAGRALDSLSTETAIALIRSLPQDQAEAVLLRSVMGLDAKSAGKVLGKRPGAVRTAAYRGLKALALRLDSEANGPGRGAVA